MDLRQRLLHPNTLRERVAMYLLILHLNLDLNEEVLHFLGRPRFCNAEFCKEENGLSMTLSNEHQARI